MRVGLLFQHTIIEYYRIISSFHFGSKSCKIVRGTTCGTTTDSHYLKVASDDHTSVLYR